MGAPREEQDIITELCFRLGLDPVIAQLLVRRGLSDAMETDAYINPSLAMLHSPFLMEGMADAVVRLDKAVMGGERIGIFADSDLDGLSALAVMERLLDTIGARADRVIRYPVENEDYGLNMRSVEDFNTEKVSLLVTLDSGIRDVAEVCRARGLGMDVLICDHHEPGDVLPDAIIINPKIKTCHYPFRELAGVGVAFKLCCAMLYAREADYNRRFLIISEEDGAVYVSKIRNMVIESSGRFQKPLDAGSIGLADCDIVLHHGLDGDFVEYLRAAGCAAAEHFLSFIEPEGETDRALTIDDWCDAYSIRSDLYASSAGLLNRLFLERCYGNATALAGFAKSSLDLVALGSIADIMPLTDENRILVRHGLDALGNTKHAGLRLLLEKNGWGLTARDVAWKIAPFLNTPGRYGKSRLLSRFFLEREESKLKKVIDEMTDMNERRKDELAVLYARLYEECRTGGMHRAGDGMYFVCDSEVPDGLCGLLANRLADAFKRPVIVVALAEGRDVVKGSGRASGSFDFFSRVAPLSSLFEKIGGHPQAFGFSIRTDRLDDARSAIASGLECAPLHGTERDLPVFADVRPDRIADINTDFVDSLRIFEPVGHRNEEPLFLSRGFRVAAFRAIGAGRTHGKFILEGPGRIEAVGWGMAGEMAEAAKKGAVDLLYTLSINEYRGERKPQMLIKSISDGKSESDEAKRDIRGPDNNCI
ncbi:MAG TPA: single-stranded-DNA-specific exonuclease RecJ [Spirochaetota bacterium]|nr:single-stranded-DNA-specific exonuclease RecJ [Spirochaetota bacterium]